MDALLKRPAIVIIVGLAIVYSIHRTINMLRSLEDSKQRSLILSRYFSPEIVKEITATPDIVQSGRRQKVTILFADIRDFTPLSESISPDELVLFLAEFRERMTRVIFGSGGAIDKFIGDAIMATFGTPRPSPVAGADSRNAVAAALGMREQLGAINADRITKRLEPIRMGIGIHTGEAIVGNIGKGDLLEYSVIGDTVNTASRIEDQCKVQGADIIISSAIYEELDESTRNIIEARPLGQTQVKGKKEPVRLFAIEYKRIHDRDLNQ
jgi:adenylate cyclase